MPAVLTGTITVRRDGERFEARVVGTDLIATATVEMGPGTAVERLGRAIANDDDVSDALSLEVEA